MVGVGDEHAELRCARRPLSQSDAAILAQAAMHMPRSIARRPSLFGRCRVEEEVNMLAGKRRGITAGSEVDHKALPLYLDGGDLRPYAAATLAEDGRQEDAVGLIRRVVIVRVVITGQALGSGGEGSLRLDAAVGLRDDADGGDIAFAIPSLSRNRDRDVELSACAGSQRANIARRSRSAPTAVDDHIASRRS